MTHRLIRTRAARIIAGTSAAALTFFGLIAASSAPAQATSASKSVQVSATVDGGTAQVGVPANVNFTLTNVAKADDFHRFTIVIPTGVTNVSPNGITGNGNWTLSLAPCGTVPSCSTLVVGSATVPRSTSRVKPGTSLVAHVILTPGSAGTLSFPVIHVEDDAFTVIGTPSITVINAQAGSFCVTDSTGGVITAGDSHTFIVSAIASGTDKPTPCNGLGTSYSGPKNVRIHLTSDDTFGTAARIVPVAIPGSSDPIATVVSQTTPTDITFSLPSASTGRFAFKVTMDAAVLGANQSLDATEAVTGGITGHSAPFSVAAGPAAGIGIDTVTDSSNGTLQLNDGVTPFAVTAGAPFTVQYFAQDAYTNPTSLPAGQVSLGVTGGTGSLSSGTSSGTTPGSDGTITGTYDSAGKGLSLVLNTNPALTNPSASAALNVAGAGSFCVTNASTNQVVAGVPQTFNVQAILLGTEGSGACNGTPTGYVGPKTVHVHFTSPDGGVLASITPVAPVNTGDGTATTVTQTSPTDATFTFSSSSTGHFAFNAVFTVATTTQSFDVSEVSPGTVAGNSGNFSVAPGAPASISLDSVTDQATHSASNISAGALFDAAFHVSDAFGNLTSMAAGGVSLNVGGGTGTFTASGLSSATSPGVDGVLSGTYSKPGVNLPVTLSSVGPYSTSNSNIVPVTFAGAAIGSGNFVPGTSGSIAGNNSTLDANGNPVCTPTATTSCASGTLPQGASGNVKLNLEDCSTAGTTSGFCSPNGAGGTIVAHLSATLKKADGVTPLYTALSPATLTYVCPVSKCGLNVPDNDGTGGPHEGWEESTEAYFAFPLYAQDGHQVTPGVDNPYYLVPSCQSNLVEEDSAAQPAATTVTGTQKSCVDIASIHRTASNDLSFTILYYDDYKLVP